MNPEYNNPPQSKAVIYQGELDYISRCVLDYPEIETGGDLFGFWTYSGFPVVQYVIGPGKNSNHQVAFFNQDIDYLQETGNALRNAHGLQHIGEWHSHHRLGLAEPSGHDVNTVIKAIKRYQLGKFFLVITNIRDTATTINGFMFTGEQDNSYNQSGWVILNGQSPVRSSFDAAFDHIVYKPATLAPSISGLTIAALSETAFLKPEYTPEYWLSHKSNHQVLKNIIEGLSKYVGAVKTFQDVNDKSVYLAFAYKNTNYRLLFPFDFPQSQPSLQASNGTEEYQLWHDHKWEPDRDIDRSTLSFTLRRLGIKKYFSKLYFWK